MHEGKYEEQALELARTRTADELQTMVRNEEQSVDRICKRSALVSLVVSACTALLIVNLHTFFAGWPTMDSLLGTVGIFAALVAPTYFLIAIPSMLIADPNPNVPFGAPEKALQIQGYWSAYQEWQAQQAKP
jgi:hypothetical protein